MAKPSFKRLLIKISGESLKGDSSVFMDKTAINRLLSHVQNAQAKGCHVALVVGGGNIWRGKESTLDFLERSDADKVGILATLMNALVLKGAFETKGMQCVVFSGVSVPSLCENYLEHTARAFLDKGYVVLFAAGTGSPFFTTDTAATLRALEMKCDLLLKLTKVDGVYDKDPKKYKDAIRFDRVTFQQVLSKGYAVMDATAVALAKEGDLPVMVGSFFEEEIVSEILEGRGTVTRMEKGE